MRLVFTYSMKNAYDRRMATHLPVLLKLEGGLGNQLFELAAGYYLAAKLETDLYLDQYSIPLTTVHGETRSEFNSFEVLSLPGLKQIHFLPEFPNRFITVVAKRNELLKRLVLKSRLIRSNKSKLPLFIETNEEKSKADLLSIDKPMKLHGNFQSWEIVERAAHYGFPRVFRLRKMPEWIVKLEKSIEFKDSIVLHFRVGDDAQTNYNFRQPDIAYYLAAISHIKSKRHFSEIYVLSDDIPRVKNWFGEVFGEDILYLEMPNESSAAERLYVLSLFGGIVCANSTFCGWAAWSIYNSGGEVVVPVPYSDGPVLGSRDFPPNWTQLEKSTGKIAKSNGSQDSGKV